MSFSSVVTIEELSPDGNSVLSAVLLHGPGLPHMGAGWKAGNALTTTWNPGNGTEGSQQNTGPHEIPSSWTGEWHRTQMGRTQSIYEDPDGQTQVVADPSILRDALEDMFRRGRRLRVTWSTEDNATDGPQDVGLLNGQLSISGSIVREGRPQEWEFKYRTIHDIEWSVTFDWVSRGGGGHRITNTRSNDVVSNSAQYTAALQALIDANALAQTQKDKPSAITLGQLAAFAALPSRLANKISRSMLQLQNDLTKIVNIASTLASQPASIQQTAINHARNAMAQANRVYQSFSQIGVETFSSKGDARSVLRAHQHFGVVQDAARLAARSAQSYATNLRRTLPAAASALQGEQSRAQNPAPGTIQNVYLTKQGDTPQKVSQRFYNSPDHAVELLKANRLSWYVAKFTPGTVLIVPVLPTVINNNSV